MSESSGSRVSATVVTAGKGDRKRTERVFDPNKAQSDPKQGGGGGDGGLSSLSSLKRLCGSLETSLNQYLTQIIDDENEPNAEVVSALIAGDAPSLASHQSVYESTTPAVGVDTIASTAQQHRSHKTQASVSAADAYDYGSAPSGRRAPSDGPKQKRCKNK